MGSVISILHDPKNLPDWTPQSRSAPTFDPEFGFQAPRKKREMKITEQEMKALMLDPEGRHYCAHALRDYNTCLRRKYPFFFLCKKELHHFNECEYDDFVLRMKEFEREKRLRIRQLKLEGKSIA